MIRWFLRSRRFDGTGHPGTDTTIVDLAARSRCGCITAVSPGRPCPRHRNHQRSDKMRSADRTGPVHYRPAAVGGVNVFYREAGPDSGPVVLLLHGFPSSSRMFRDVIPRLSDAYRVIAPDYPAFGHSAVPGRSAFGYTFDHLADVVDGLLEQLGIGKFAIYVMDFGAAVGVRLAPPHPPRLSASIVRNAPPYPLEPPRWL